MSRNRRKFSAAFKSKVALEIISNEKTISEIASHYQLDPTLIAKWKRTFLENSSKIFEDPRKKDEKLIEKEVYIGDLEKKVGQLTIERDWLKKKSDELLGPRL